VVTPFVERTSPKRPWVIALGLFGAGALISSAAIGGLLGVLGSRVQAWVPRSERLAFVAALALVLGVADLANRYRLTLRRQTNPTWRRTLGLNRASFFWGLDLGLGFSTIRVTSLFWLATVVATALVPPELVPLVMSAYGVGLVTSVVSFAALARRAETRRVQAAGVIALNLSRRVSVAAGAIGATFAICILAVSVS